MTGGSKDASPDIDAFMAKYGVTGFPTCLVLSADGALLRTVGHVLQPPEILAATRECADVEADFQAFQAAVQKHDEPALWSALADAYTQRRQHAEAVKVLTTLAAKDPAPRRWKALAQAQVAAGDLPGAMGSFDKLIAADGTLENRVAKAAAQLRTGDLDGAIKGVTESVAKADDATKADAKQRIAGLLFDHIVRLCNEEGDFKGAIKPLDLLLEAYGDTPPAQQARQFEGQIRQLANR
jgi:tetratricopeptide (TPR) repeat protein